MGVQKICFKSRKQMRSKLFLFFIYFMTCNSVSAQTDIDPTQKLKLFLDCRTECFEMYLIDKIRTVDFVRDRAQANVHLIINKIPLPNNRKSYQLRFIGIGQLAIVNNTFIHETAINATSAEIRKGLRNKIRLGLVGFQVHTKMGEHMRVSVKKEEKIQIEQNDDPWNYWSMEAWANASINKESQNQTIRTKLGFEANRVTENWKILQGIEYSYRGRKIERSDRDPVTSRIIRAQLSGKVVRSLNEHFSIGLMNQLYHSTFRNIKLRTRLGPAIEYSIFPYSEVTRRELTLAYHFGWRRQYYFEETIFGVLSEKITDQAIRAQLRLREPWGNITSSLEYSHFANDWSKYRVLLDNRLSIRVRKGLSVDFEIEFDWIQDQVSLEKGDASLEDILLTQKQLLTNFDLSISVGFSYTFGSIYNNVVNTRL